MNLFVLACVRTMMSAYGYFNSPGPSIDKCRYNIKVASGKSVKIDFPVFSIGTTTDCSAGSLKIYEDRVSDSNLKVTFCGLGSKTFQSYSNNVIIIYNPFYSQSQFHANYSATNKGTNFSLYFANCLFVCNYT